VNIFSVLQTMVTLKEFVDPVQAGFMQSMLVAHGIRAELWDQGASAWTAGRLLVPIRLVVPCDQMSEAEILIRDFALSKTDNDPSDGKS